LEARGEEGELLHAGKHFMQQPNPLAIDGGSGIDTDAGDVAAGMGERVDQPLLQRIACQRNDRNR
jgi:hypothetical protein